MKIGDKVAARYDTGEDTYIGKIIDIKDDIIVVKCGLFGGIKLFEPDIDYIVVLKESHD